MADQHSQLLDPPTDVPSLTGKVILITGANAGLGKQNALELAKYDPGRIFMADRDIQKDTAAGD